MPDSHFCHYDDYDRALVGAQPFKERSYGNP